MNIVRSVLTGLLRLAGLLLSGSGAGAPDVARVDNAGYPDVMNLRSTHVDPHRTGNYFPWTERDE